MKFNTIHHNENGSIDINKTRKYKNTMIWNGSKVVAQFHQNLYETKDKKIISLLKNKEKFPFINYKPDEEPPAS
jgi:hypothetical protein